MRLVILTLALMLVGCSEESPRFQPGQWSLSFKISEAQQPVFWGAGANCIDNSEAADLPAIILSQTAFGQCTANRADYKDGKFSLDLTCDGKTQTTTAPMSKVLLKGPYTATRFDSDLTAELEFDGARRQLSGTLSAYRVGACAESRQGNAS